MEEMEQDGEEKRGRNFDGSSSRSGSGMEEVQMAMEVQELQQPI